uniref:Uncharacterized protein n=1 Tax=Knipowitschia caucasica TaxID=637954 RepID=A0AAV2KXJ7_KNICA
MLSRFYGLSDERLSSQSEWRLGELQPITARSGEWLAAIQETVNTAAVVWFIDYAVEGLSLQTHKLHPVFEITGSSPRLSPRLGLDEPRPQPSDGTQSTLGPASGV